MSDIDDDDDLDFKNCGTPGLIGCIAAIVVIIPFALSLFLAGVMLAECVATKVIKEYGELKHEYSQIGKPKEVDSDEW